MTLLRSIQLHFSRYKIKKSTSKIAWSGPQNFWALTHLPVNANKVGKIYHEK